MFNNEIEEETIITEPFVPTDYFETKGFSYTAES